MREDAALAIALIAVAPSTNLPPLKNGQKSPPHAAATHSG